MTRLRQRIHGALASLALSTTLGVPVARAEGATLPEGVQLPATPKTAAEVYPAEVPAPKPVVPKRVVAKPVAAKVAAKAVVETPVVPAPVVEAPPAPAPVAAVPAAPKPVASGDKKWLRAGAPEKKKPVATAPSVISPFRLGVTALVVLGLGGAALFHRLRRRNVAVALRSELNVVSRARVGNKADVVVLDVGGRKILLGVTDAEVSRLAWLDGEVEGAEIEPVGELSSFEARALATSSPATRALEPAAEERVETPRRFRDVLRGALAQPTPKTVNARQQSVALAIAEETENVVFTRSSAGAARVAAPAGAPEMVDIEGQARGLLLRLAKRS